MGHVIVWEFAPRAGKAEEFEQVYGPDGEWARLFKRSPDYRGTELLRLIEGGSYLTIDRWASAAAFSEFQDQWRTEYETLDRRCEVLTEREELVGRFEIV